MIQLTQGNFDCTQPIGEDGTPQPGGELCPTAITLDTFSVRTAEGPTTILFVFVVFVSSIVLLAKRRKMI